MKTEIDSMMEAEYMSWNKKQLIQQIKNRDRAVERLNDDLNKADKEMEGLQKQVETLQRLLQEERISHNKVNNFLTDKIAVLRKALENVEQRRWDAISLPSF